MNIDNPRAKLEDLHPGTQIAYIPSHAETLDDPAIEYGFVTSTNKEFAFCRFYDLNNWNIAKEPRRPLRTKSNSEPCSPGFLIVVNTVPQKDVIETMKELGYEFEIEAGEEQNGIYTGCSN